MHYHLEIVMPPTEDVQAAVTEIMRPFDENGNDDEDYSPRYTFWDYWRIGGRWSGDKLLAVIGDERVKAFRRILHEKEITISALRFGKPALEPASQAENVNRIWNEFFPEAPVKECPLFDNYQGDFGDIMCLKDAPQNMACSHVIIAASNRKGDRLGAKFMVRDRIYNGVTWQDTTWDRTLGGAIRDHSKHMEGWNPKYAERATPTDDWLVVTIDYHS